MFLETFIIHYENDDGDDDIWDIQHIYLFLFLPSRPREMITMEDHQHCAKLWWRGHFGFIRTHR